MKSKVASKYEDKRWYRVVKSIYVMVFVLLLAFANFVLYLSASGSDENYFWPFVITNAVIIFGMGTAEGLFWYIVRGKWGYPKDESLDTN